MDDNDPLARLGARGPFGGLTVLLVEDSRYASEAVRLMCQRSGARMRRADSLRAARRHLRTYSPNVAIIDLGLPDGSGADLIAQLHNAHPRVPVIIGISGDDNAQELARGAGADGFLAKPITNLGAFQHAILPHLKSEHAQRPFLLSNETIAPDPLAELDDLRHANGLLSAQPDTETVDYLLQFLTALARMAADADLTTATARLSDERRKGAAASVLADKLTRMLKQRGIQDSAEFNRQLLGQR